jgi:hypothetical protein
MRDAIEMKMSTYLATIALLLAPIVFSGSQSQLLAVEAQNQTGSAAPFHMCDMTQMAAMMKMHQQMMADMRAADTRLDQLVGEMNAATGDAKVAALARVVTELVGQQKAMHARMSGMADAPAAGEPAKRDR